MKERVLVLMFLCFNVLMMSCGLPPEKEMPNFGDAVVTVDVDAVNNHFDTGIDGPENLDIINDDGEKFDTPKNDAYDTFDVKDNDSNDTETTIKFDTKDTFDVPQETDGDQGYDTDDSEVSHDTEVESEVYCLPILESCNNQDDDCDGFVDEDLDLGNCEIGIGECKAFGKNLCLDGEIVCDAVVGESFVEICDEKDNDCDGETDEDLGLGEDCEVWNNKCKAIGKMICKEDGSVICDVMPPESGDEICDNQDNDCDGEVDEDFTDLGDECDMGNGECVAFGQKICSTDGLTTVCDSVPGTPYDEICDGKDNDCDTFIDEDFPELGTNCWVGVGECEKKGVYVCNFKTGQLKCNVEPGEAVDELCDGLDNDCDSETDEDWVDELGADCENGIGECKSFGKIVCDTGVSNFSLTTECDAIPSEPQAEFCNYLDDNCDGETDENWPELGIDCENGIGECKVGGKMICDTGVSNFSLTTICDAIPNESQDELCDSLDNNCDGETDENWPELGSDCDNGVGECKVSGKMICDTGVSNFSLTTICDAVPSEPQTEICDYLDNNCNGLNDKDDAFPMLDTNCSIGNGECFSTGKYICDLNTGFAKCGAPVISPQDEVCDNKDNNCNKLIDDVDASKLQTDNANCGACFTPCVSLPGAASVTCVNAKCTPVTCTAKYYDADKIPENGCECTISSGAVEICDGKDNDCDGQADEWCDNLVMYLPFDGDWNDKSKYGNNATPFNGVGFTSDAMLGKAAYFDGVDDYAVVADSVSMDSIKEEFTWFIMVKVQDLSGIKAVIFNKIASQPSFVAIWSDMSPCPSTDCFCFKINGSNSTCQPAVELNKWYLFTVRYKKGELVLYLNGSSYWFGNTFYPQNVGSNLEIGNDAGAGLKDNIDEFIFYNKALSDAEIADYYQKIK